MLGRSSQFQWSMGVLSLLGFFAAEQLLAQQESRAQRTATSNLIAARVDSRPIRILRLQHELARVQRTRKVRLEAQPALRAQLLEQAVNQLLVLRYLEYSDQAAPAAAIDLAVENLQKRIAQQDQTLEQYLKTQGLNSAELHQKVAWQIGWSRFLNRYLTEKNYQRYFEQHQREFDGTQLQVSHVLLKLSRDADVETVKRQQAAMAQLREQIQSGKLSFADCAKQFSEGPSAQQGGDLGWIQRYEPMSEEFSVAAFQLQKGEISLPIRSPFGIHLVACRQIKPGTKKWQQVREPLKEAITQYLFSWAAQRERARVRVEYTGAWPYFRPGTKILVTAAADVEPCP